VWTIANTLTVVFIAEGIAAVGGDLDVERATMSLLIGAVIWSYLGIVFEILTETVAWERWEGTIEYTFMAPLSRAVHLLGMGAFAVLYGVMRTAALFAVVALFFGLGFPDANFGAALLLLAVASVSFVGVGMATAVLPLVSPEKGAQLGFIAQGLLLVVSGVYYPVEVLPGWMQAIATISPATYALEGLRSALLDGSGVAEIADDLWPLLVIGAVMVPVGLAVFRAGERYAKRHGKLKRAG
jgi:ABC-2 type transport system permease protein